MTRQDLFHIKGPEVFFTQMFSMIMYLLLGLCRLVLA